MKKIIFYMLILASISNANSISGLGLAFSHGDDKSKNITTLLNYNVALGIDLRFEYNRNISDYKEYFSTDINRYALFATSTLPLGYSFSVTPKVGLAKTNGKFKTYETLKKITDSSIAFTYGAELNYNLSNKVSAFLGYTDYGHSFKKIKDIKASKINSKNITVGLKINL